MTHTTINFKSKNTFDQMDKGTILKRGCDLFIVAEFRKPTDKIEEALYHSHPSQRGRRFQDDNGRYALISLSNGLNLYGVADTLDALRIKVRDSQYKFEIIESIQISEV